MKIDNIEVPDYDDLINLSEEIKRLSIEKSQLELTIKDKESEVILTMTSNPEHFINGKPPSMSFLNATFKFSGIDRSLIEYRNKLSVVEAELEFAQNKLYISKTMIDIWRTVSANKRASIN